MSDSEIQRHTKAIAAAARAPLSNEARAPLEAENGLRQFDEMIRMLEEYLNDKNGRFELKPWQLQKLNRIAIDNLTDKPGAYRQTEVEIGKSKHVPPAWEMVARHVDDLCDYVNRNWRRPALHLAAYTLWRINWVHPFPDGNGRTARVVSYLVLCARLRLRLAGRKTIPDLITEADSHRTDYYKGLEAADGKYKQGKIDTSRLERFLKALLSRQMEEAASDGDDDAPVQVLTAHEKETLRRDTKVIEDAIGDPGPSATVKAAWIGGAALVLASAVGLARCGGSNRVQCITNEQRPCTCVGGAAGFQSCIQDGSQFGECSCPGEPDATPPPLDAGPPYDARDAADPVAFDAKTDAIAP